MALTLAAAASPAAVGTECAAALAYPGDDATKPALGQWMAAGARARGLPGELPVMGALVESGVANLRGGDAGSVGFFAMRVAIWNTGPYQGFPDNPDLQLMWFLDQAIAARDRRTADGDASYGSDPAGWGEWIADVLRPAEQYRGRYALRLVDARELIGAACAGWPPPPAAPPLGVALAPATTAPPAPDPSATRIPAPAPDTTAPLLRLGGRGDQAAVDRGAVLVTAGCPAERCSVSATGALTIAGSARALLGRAKTRQVARGQRVSLRLPLSARARRAARRALRQRATLLATIRVVAVDDTQNRTIQRRTVRVTG